MIIHNDTIALGDTINTFRITQALILKFKKEKPNEMVEVHWSTEAGYLFPAYKYGAKNIINSRPENANIRYSYHDHVLGRSDTDRSLDFSAAMAKKYDLNLEGLVVELNLPTMTGIPHYDFVIAPQVLNNPGKNMTMDFWQELINNLKSNYPNYSICVVGKSVLPPDEDLTKVEPAVSRFKDENYLIANTSQYLNGCDYFWDRPLLEVAQLLENTKRMFISVDSGLSWVNNYIKTPHMELFTMPPCIILQHYPNRHDNIRYEKTVPITMEETMQHIKKGLQSL